MKKIEHVILINMQQHDIETILNTLSLSEKIQLCSGASAWRTPSIPSKNIPILKVSDGPNGVRGDGRKPSTSFPVGICMSSTFNNKLIHKVGQIIAAEAKQKDVDVVLGPTINLHRSPLGGRNFECYSEDPYLSGKMAIAFTDGVQSCGIGACPKHFVCNDSEFERHTLSVEIDERTLREVYLRPFEMVVKKSNPWMIMAAYNRINGIYACSHDRLINQILKQEWNWNGCVVSDWFAAKETIPNALGGLDLEMPGPSRVWGTKLLKAIEDQEVSEEIINDKTKRVLRTLLRAGRFNASKFHETPEVGVDVPEHRHVARAVAAEGMVLLKNDHNTLPLVTATSSLPQQRKTILCIGPNLMTPMTMGGGSSVVRTHKFLTPLQAIQTNYPNHNVVSLLGCLTHKFCPKPDRKCFTNTSTNDITTKEGLVLTLYDDIDKTMPRLNSIKIINTETIYLNNAFLPGNNTELAPCEAALAIGFYMPDISGIHEFGVLAVGSVRLFVNDTLVADNWNYSPGEAFFGRGSHEKKGTFTMTQNISYKITIEYKRPDDLDVGQISGIRWGIVKPTHDLMQECIDQASKTNEVEAVLIFAGTTSEWETEGCDRLSMSLPGRQNEMISKLAQVHPRVIVINNSGSPITMPWVNEVGAILQTWFSGEEYANALCDILTGKINPSGKLPITFPIQIEDTPAYANYPGANGMVRYEEGVFVGYKNYVSRNIATLFCFGHGLSYSTFEMKNMCVDKQADGTWHVAVDLYNTGIYDGMQVVQLYIEPVLPKVVRPKMELRQYQKVHLNSGERSRVAFNLDPMDTFAYWDVTNGNWHVDSGAFIIHLSFSSEDISISKQIEVTDDGKRSKM